MKGQIKGGSLVWLQYRFWQDPWFWKRLSPPYVWVLENCSENSRQLRWNLMQSVYERDRATSSLQNWRWTSGMINFKPWNPSLAESGWQSAVEYTSRKISFKFPFIHLDGERHCESEFLAQEHNTMSPARPTWTRTTRSGVERTNREATAPQRDQHLQTFHSETTVNGMQPRHTVQHYAPQNCSVRLQPWFNFTILLSNVVWILRAKISELDPMLFKPALFTRVFIRARVRKIECHRFHLNG